MIFEKTYETRIGDSNQNGGLKYSSILEILEDVGSCHSNLAQDNVLKGSKSGIAWILTEWNVQIINLPKAGETLHIKTWATAKLKASIVGREFEVTDKSGELLIIGMAKFVLLDLVTQKLTRITPELYERYSPQPNSKFSFDKGRLRESDSYIKEIQIPIRKADIDFNGHVHNTVYLDYALEILPQDIGKISFIRVAYKSQVKPNEVLTVKYSQGESSNIALYHSNGTLSAIVELS